MHRTAEQVEDASAQRLTFEIPKRDVDGGDGVRGDAAVIAVPPRLLLVLPPKRLGLHRVLADEIRRHALDDRLGGEIGLGKLRDRLAPSDLAVVRRDLGQAEVAERVEVVGLRIADRDGFDPGDFHIRRPYPIAPRNKRHAFDADVDLDQPAGHCRAGDIERAHIAAIERAALAEHAVEDRAAGLQEMQRLAVLVDHINAAGRNRGDPEVAVGVDLQAVGNVALRHRMQITCLEPSGLRRTTFMVYDSTQTTEPSGSTTIPFGYT